MTWQKVKTEIKEKGRKKVTLAIIETSVTRKIKLDCLPSCSQFFKKAFTFFLNNNKKNNQQVI